MENPSGSQQQEFIQTNQGSASSYNNGQTVIPSLEYPQGVTMDWTPQEQAILEEGLAQYASESVILRYAKIALQLKSKTVRDVALRCRWMRDHLLDHQHTSISLPTNSDKVIDPTTAPSFIPIQQRLPTGVQGMIINKEAVCNLNNGITGHVRHLLQQNTQAFNQISLNIATCQMHENIGLLSQTRDNIYKILNSLDDVPELMQMPPLRIKLNEELASFILPSTALPMKR